MLFCWLTSREHSHNAHTVPINVPSGAVSARGFLSFLEQSKMDVQLTPSHLSMSQISFPCQDQLFIESRGLEKCCSPGYHGTDVNPLSN